MDSLPVLKYGNPILRKKVCIVKDFAIIPELIKEMYKTIEAEHGIGLAANQVGLSINLMVIDTRNLEDDEGESFIFVNSEILESQGEIIMDEGCLSIPDIRAEIKRPETIILKYQDIEQRFHEKQFSGLTSRVIQHEMDHLNGKLFIDYLPQTKRILLNKRLLELSKVRKPSAGINL